MIDDRVDADSRFTRFAVTDNQFSLAATNGSHGVDRLDSRLHWFGNRLSFGNTRSDDFNRTRFAGIDRSFPIERVAQRIKYAADDRITDGNRKQRAQGFHLIAFVDLEIVAEDDDTDAVFFEVKCQADDATGKLNHFTGSDVGQSMHPCDTITDFENGPDFADINLAFVLLDLLLYDGSNFVSTDLHIIPRITSIKKLYCYCYELVNLSMEDRIASVARLIVWLRTWASWLTTLPS